MTLLVFIITALSLGSGWDAAGTRDPTLLIGFDNHPIREECRLVMYYSGGQPQRWQIGRAVSYDGYAWEREPSSPVLHCGKAEAWDGGSISCGGVLKISETHYRMYYSGMNGERASIGLAMSKDGIVWKKYSGNPILCAPSFWCNRLLLPHVFILPGSFIMVCEGLYGDRFEIVMAASDDGVSWIPLNNGNPILKPSKDGWDSRTVANPKLYQLDDGSYAMTYNGASDGHKYDIGIAYSDDLVTWQRCDAPILRRSDVGNCWGNGRIEGALLLKPDYKRMLFFGRSSPTSPFRIYIAIGDFIKLEGD